MARGINVKLYFLWAFLFNFSQAYSGYLQDQQCGKTFSGVSRVVGGLDATLGEWPWQAWIHVNGKGFTCGGSLIMNEWVVTAAHCVQEPDAKLYHVVLGDLDRDKLEGTEQKFEVQYIIKHRLYSKPVPNANDIALIKLSRSAKLNHFVNTVCLPRRYSNVLPGTKCFVTGWGKTTIDSGASVHLQQADLPVVTNKACAKKLKTSAAGQLDNGTWAVTDAMICAGDSGKTDKSGCNGDSGGPFVCRHADGRWFLEGVVNWGDPDCSSRNHFSVFARVSHFKDWIERQITKATIFSINKNEYSHQVHSRILVKLE